MSTLDTGIKLVKNVNRYNIGFGSISELKKILKTKKKNALNEKKSCIVFFIDEFFESQLDKLDIEIKDNDKIFFVSTDTEPTTESVDNFTTMLNDQREFQPIAIVGIGGGITLDTAKAVSNLLANGGRAEAYQGWDLVKKPGIFKIGIPTISGTGAEATRTCVLINPKNGLKLGMNSDYTVFDHIIMDPNLSATVERNQYFYSGMDAYIHCLESLSGFYRNAIGDAYSRETIRLCREVFNSDDMMSDINREKLMVASYLGGCAIATSYVGVIHPFSAGLSVILGLHHCVSNCIVMNGVEEFYPKEYYEFREMAAKQNIKIPSGICWNLSDHQFQSLYHSTIIHEKPLTNALGENFKEILTFEKVKSIFSKM